MNREAGKQKRHELSLFVMNGTVYPTSTERFKLVIFSPAFIAVSIVFLAVMLVAKIAIFGNDGGYLFLSVFWGLFYILFISLWYWQFLLACKLQHLWAPRSIPTVLLHIIPLLLLSTATKAFSDFWFGSFSGFEAPRFLDVFRLLLLTVVFEFMVTKWVLPYVQGTQASQLRLQNAKPDPVAKQFLFDGKSYFLNEVLFMRSAEHYVELVTNGGSAMHRAKLGDIVEQFDSDDGVQTHRSYWVPRWSIEALTCNKNKKFIVLTNGSEIPVSRGRQDAVSDWFARNIADKKGPGTRPGQFNREV